MSKRVMWPALAGYLAGLATAGVIALLMPAAEPGAGATPPAAAAPASGGSAPSPPATSAKTAAAMMSAAAGSQDVPQHAAAALSPEARARIAPLEAKLASDPGDLLTRKQLAVLLLQNQQMMQAYEHASAILAAHPDDPDGLYVHGVVRLAMGHAPKAIELLDKVLARYPEHALALQARADAQRKIGDESGAALSEAKAREAARSDGSEVEQLLDAASSGTLLEMMRSSSDVGLTPSGGTDVGLTPAEGPAAVAEATRAAESDAGGG